MRRMIKTGLLGAVAALALVFAFPGSSNADVTEVRHKHYYGHRHVPHYYRGYRHRYPGYHSYRYSYPRSYYHGPRVHVYRYPHRYHDYYRYHPHGGVRVGPLHFQWWH